jgi:hypothetical protein
LCKNRGNFAKVTSNSREREGQEADRILSIDDARVIDSLLWRSGILAFCFRRSGRCRAQVVGEKRFAFCAPRSKTHWDRQNEIILSIRGLVTGRILRAIRELLATKWRFILFHFVRRAVLNVWRLVGKSHAKARRRKGIARLVTR